jgi:hypothetical protein
MCCRLRNMYLGVHQTLDVVILTAFPILASILIDLVPFERGEATAPIFCEFGAAIDGLVSALTQEVSVFLG